MSVYADLVERLRRRVLDLQMHGWIVQADDVREAADAIEALEARNAGLLDQWVMAEQEITRLTLQQERP